MAHLPHIHRHCKTSATDLTEGDYDLKDFAQHVQSSLNKYYFHPSFQGKWTCVDRRAADGSFNGFKIENIQRGLDASSFETDKTDVQNGGLTWAACDNIVFGNSVFGNNV